MTKLLLVLWRDDAGFILSAELIMIATLLTLGMVVGLSELSGAVNNEMTDMAGAVEGMSQDYWTNGDSGSDGSGDADFDQSW